MRILDTGLVENTEEFYVGLEIPTTSTNLGVVKYSPSNATVIITDDDSERCSYSLYNSAHNYVEHTVNVQICVVALLLSNIHSTNLQDEVFLRFDFV